MAIQTPVTIAGPTGRVLYGGAYPAGYSTLSGAAAGGDVGGSGDLASTNVPLPPGTITNAGALNRLASLDPRFDPLANPAYPLAPPWEVPGFGTFADMMAFAGAVFVPELGAQGTLLIWTNAGHSVAGPNMWAAFDVAANDFRRHGPRPLPSNGLAGYTAGINPDPAAFDHAWGDWDGDWVGWHAGFAQPGVRLPEGGHTRNSFAHRPGHKAGNIGGEIFQSWHATGVNSSTGIASAHVWNVDTETWSRAGSVAPEAGSAVGSVIYHALVDHFVGPHKSFSSPANFIDIAPGHTKAFVRRPMTSGGRVHEQDATAFGWVDGAGKSWHVVIWNYLVANDPPLRMFAVCVDDLIANIGPEWIDLTVSATSYPVDAAGLTQTVSWPRCPINGSYYAVNRVAGSNKLWKLTPPTSGVITGLWTMTDQTLAGALLGTDADYARLHWAPARTAFLWVGPGVGDDPQYIRPTDI